MSPIPFLVLVCLAQIMARVSYENLHIFINRFHVNRTILIITTLEALGDVWFTTKVSIDERRLIDYFQTNASETREPLLWFRTTRLMQTLNFYGIFTENRLPYQECFYHVSRANFFISGYHNVSALISTVGLSADEERVSSYTYIDLEEHLRCEPRFDIPRCHDANQPLHYETSDVIVLRAVFTRRCPMDSFIQYYWTLHDSTESRGTLKPELKVARYRLKVRHQSPLNRLVMVRINARVVGRRTPLVARCYLALAPQRLYAVIRGGPYRKVFRGKTISVNGSPSRDLSLPKNAIQNLLFEWSCDSTKNNDKVCKLNMGSGKGFVIPSYTQANEQTLKFVLHIRSTYDYLRSAVAMQTILFSSFPRRYININIVCVTNCKGNKYISQLPIHLKGQCLCCRTKKITKWTWIVDKKLVGSSNRLIFNVTKKMSITIYLNMEATHRYKQTSTYQGTSSIHLEKNLGPINTICYVKPLDGEAIETIFFIQCENKNALYKPLQYCVGIRSLLIDECKTDELIMVRLPPTSNVEVQVWKFKKNFSLLLFKIIKLIVKSHVQYSFFVHGSALL
ncbi:uncharacterized protein LOC135441085 isoform X3 [Drosophila montana]|uniref:uncharacterized protein LOC135441085 isoform X3 n=1 Tax=Drosophila montana TaxID=40370 RepID=UPI00313ABACD